MTGAIALRSARTEDLDSATRDAIVRVCVAAHDNDDFTRLFTFILAGGVHVLAFRGSELVGHAVATTRWLKPAGLPLLRTAYVDAVATLPAYQGLGYGSALMKQLAGDVDSTFAIGCLQTERVGFYERLDWVPWRGPLAGRDADRLVPTPDQSGVMVLRLSTTPPLDLDAQLTIECQPARIW